jgi:hypothetical protein
MKDKMNEGIAEAIFNSTSKAAQSRNIIKLRGEVENYVKLRIIEELEKQLELAEYYNASVKLSERVYEIKTRLR